MDITIIRFNRPLLIKMEWQKTPYYQTVYGFAIPKPINEIKSSCIEPYVGYLVGLHDLSNGGNLFSISYELRGVPDWVDKRGYFHPTQDAWVDKIKKKCIKKLNLTYSIIPLDIDEADLNNFTNEEHLIVDELFYYDLERYQSEKEKSLMQAEQDELPS